MFKGIDFDSTIFRFDFWTFLTMWYFFVFHLILTIFHFYGGGQFDLCRSPDCAEKTMHWPVGSHWIVRENHVLTCRKSLNCQWKQSTDLSQVTEIVGENHVPTCRKTVNCPKKPSTYLSQVTEVCVKTMHWPVASQVKRKPCTNLSQVIELSEKTMY
jgi:hypothetical protein